MHINATLKTEGNDYFQNTRNLAKVHLRREFDALDEANADDGTQIVVENLGEIVDLIAQVRTSLGLLVSDLPEISFSGNVITITPVVGHEQFVSNGAVANFLIVGTR